MKFILSPAAVRDLQSISDYTLQNWGAEQEELYLIGLLEKLAAIQSDFGSYRLREDLAEGCRSARHEKHVIFFSIQAETLQVIRILHGAINFSSHLTSGDFE